MQEQRGGLSLGGIVFCLKTPNGLDKILYACVQNTDSGKDGIRIII